MFKLMDKKNKLVFAQNISLLEPVLSFTFNFSAVLSAQMCQGSSIIVTFKEFAHTHCMHIKTCLESNWCH